MEHSTDYDAIVVGAGIMGSATAYHLSKRGKKTLLLEQFDFLHHRGSSHGESRTIRLTYPEPSYSPLVSESSQLWEQAQAEIGFRVYFKSQHLDVGHADDKDINSIIQNLENHSIPHRVLNSKQLSHHFSGKITIPENGVGVVTEGGVIKPTKAVAMFQSLALKNGAILKDHMEVNKIVKDEVKGGVTVITAKGEKFWGKGCVVTAGAWIKRLINTVAGKEVPVQPVETTLSYWRIKDGYEGEYSINGNFPTFAKYGVPYVYGTPSLEFPGLIKIAVHDGYACDPDKRAWGPGVPMDSLKKWIKESFSGRVDYSGPAATQLCMYSMTPDEDYVIDYLGGEFGKDVVIAGGFSGHGFKMGPVIGRILTDLLLGEGKDDVLENFRLGRFQENPKGNAKSHL